MSTPFLWHSAKTQLCPLRSPTILAIILSPYSARSVRTMIGSGALGLADNLSKGEWASQS